MPNDFKFFKLENTYTQKPYFLIHYLKDYSVIFRVQLIFYISFLFQIGLSSLAAAQVFEGFWEQKAVVRSQLPIWGQKVEKEDHRIFVTADFLKTMDLNDGRTNIFDYQKRMIFRLDPTQQTVAAISFSDFSALMKRNWENLERANRHFHRKLKTMTPQQRQIALQFLGGKATGTFNLHPQIELKRLPDSKTIGGYSCFHEQILADGRPFLDAYWTDAILLPKTPLKLFQQFGYFPFELPPHVLELKGFPMQTTLNIQMGIAFIRSSSRVVRVVRKKISKSEFQIPENYRRVPWNYMKLF